MKTKYITEVVKTIRISTVRTFDDGKSDTFTKLYRSPFAAAKYWGWTVSNKCRQRYLSTLDRSLPLDPAHWDRFAKIEKTAIRRSLPIFKKMMAP